ncbi:MAG: hypothetical protein FWC97_09015, partial [Treponema sp.]|nr:hypothetical protein [Treponema sp.]
NAYNHGKKFFANMVYDVGWIHNSALNGGIYGPSWTYITEEGRFQSPGSGRRIWEEQVPLYVNYVVETVREFHNYVGAWGIWNEPCNRPRFWTASDEDFIYLTWQTVKGIRELEEELIREGHRTAEQQRIQIVIGGLSPLATPGFIRGLLDVEPELRALADGISYHPYSSSSVTTALVFESFRNTVEPFGFADKIWLTEVGYPTGGAYPSVVHPNFKASEVIKTLTELAIRGAVNAIWYHFMDDRTPATQDVANSEHWFGLVLNPCYTPKTGAPAFAMWGRKIPGSRHEPNFPISSNLPSAFRYHYFRGQNDEHYLIIWRDFPVPANVTITLPGTNQRVYITDARTWPTDWNDAGPNTPLTIPNSRELGETSSHSVGPLAQFFVWENNDPTARPTISGN